MLLPNPSNYFDSIYAIYEEAFPAIERRTREGQRAVLEKPQYRIRVIKEAGKEETDHQKLENRICAFLGYWELDSCIFLEHLATLKQCRGKGYGRILIEECIQEGREKGKPLFLEIEPVTEAHPMTGRRENFYHRCGFHTNHFYYEQMPLKPGDLPIPLWIMSWPDPVTKEGFWPCKKEIYQEVYRVIETQNG